jgi:hypothetical protein
LADTKGERSFDGTGCEESKRVEYQKISRHSRTKVKAEKNLSITCHFDFDSHRIEAALKIWIQQQRESNVMVSRSEIKGKALEFSRQFGLHKFKGKT